MSHVVTSDHHVIFLGDKKKEDHLLVVLELL